MRAALAALLLLPLLVPTQGGAMAAWGGDDAGERVERAEQERDRSHRIVEQAAADRDRLEAELVGALLAYEETARQLATADARLERISRSLDFAGAGASQTEVALDERAVVAYVEAVVAAPVVLLETGTAEEAIVVDHLLDAEQDQVLSDLADLLARVQALEALHAAREEERDTVAVLAARLAEDTSRLEALLARADAALADAFQRALAADAEHRAAVDEIARARAAEAAASAVAAPVDPGEAEPPEPDPPPAPAPPAEEEGPAIAPGERAESWRPLVAAHFAPDLVDEALVIIQCESGGDPSAVNPYSGAAGLFQFLPGTWAVAGTRAGVGDRSPLDPEASIVAAAWLTETYRARGDDPWRPWHCRAYL